MKLSKEEISLLRRCVELRQNRQPFFFVWEEGIVEESVLLAFHGTEVFAWEHYQEYLDVNFFSDQTEAPVFSEWLLEHHRDKLIINQP